MLLCCDKIMRAVQTSWVGHGRAKAAHHVRNTPDVTLTWNGFEAPDSIVRAARLMKAHGVEFTVHATVCAENVDRPLDFYYFLRDEVGTRFIELIPIVEDIAAYRILRAEEWGPFLIEIFDEWVRCDFGKVFVQLFDIALTQRGDYPARHFLTASNHEAALSVLEAGYRTFFAHVQRGRITAFSESAVKRFAV
jgi:sulfatase maturation enzyme AslB (radical SAM superfamily)